MLRFICKCYDFRSIENCLVTPRRDCTFTCKQILIRDSTFGINELSNVI